MIFIYLYFEKIKILIYYFNNSKVFKYLLTIYLYLINFQFKKPKKKFFTRILINLRDIKKFLVNYFYFYF